MTQLTKGVFVDHSISSMTGAAQLLLAADPQRQALIINNAGTAKAIGFDNTVTLNAAGSITMQANTFFIMTEAVPSNALWIIGTNGQAITCWTYP
jgi:hypothetical protein